MIDLYSYEKQFYDHESDVICGVDEAGAGPLLGPVYAAAVILPHDKPIEGLNDSKKLNEKKRKDIYDKILDIALDYCIASINAKEIDETDILSARMKAMQLAINGLKTPVKLALIDGNRDKGKSFTITTEHKLIVHGDALSASIAAASILAKVSRDTYCIEVLDKLYPMYLISKHKGYGTALHYEMIKRYGPCEEHRKSFLKNLKEK